MHGAPSEAILGLESPALRPRVASAARLAEQGHAFAHGVSAVAPKRAIDAAWQIGIGERARCVIGGAKLATPAGFTPCAPQRARYPTKK